MKCQNYQRLLYEHRTGSLPKGMQQVVDKHLDGCDLCREMFEEIKSLSRSITDLLKETTSSILLGAGVGDAVVDRVESLPMMDGREEMMRLFETLSFRERIRRVLEGLKQPKDSGEYKWARLEMTRLASPVSGVVVPILVLCLLALLAGLAPKRARMVNVRIAELEQIEELEEPEDLPEPEIQPPDPEDIVEPTDSFIPSTSKDSVGPDADFSPQPAPFDAVAIIKSPVIMKGIFGNRSPGARGSALGRYGGSGHTEGAVLRALRWLKKYQESDGSWNCQSGALGATFNRWSQGKPAAMTGLALMAFLAHGETPASAEFGQTVEKALKWMVENQQENGWYQDNNDNGYNHPIAAYAMCEAYAMTKLPTTKTAAQKSVQILLDRQHPAGGWNYVSLAGNCQSISPTPTLRTDVSITAWCVQALKAGQMAGLSNPGITAALNKARECYSKALFMAGENRFQYDNTGKYLSRYKELTCAGTLAMQLLGAGNDDVTKKTLEWTGQHIQPVWQKAPAPIYHWYYTTQAKFHAGGETWKAWNKQFAPMLVGKQTIQKGAGVRGKDIGYWTSPGCALDADAHVYNTAMCALMLQVYYRYLPTFKKPEEIMADAAEAGGAEQQGVVEAKDLDIEIEL